MKRLVKSRQWWGFICVWFCHSVLVPGGSATAADVPGDWGGTVVMGSDPFLYVAGEEAGGAGRFILRFEKREGEWQLNRRWDVDGRVEALAADGAGGVVAGGSFARVDGQPRHHLARLLADGRLDPEFGADQGPNGPVTALLPRGEGGYMAGGRFTGFGADEAIYLCRLDERGRADQDWHSPLGAMHALEAGVVDMEGLGQSGELVVSGLFELAGKTARVVRLNQAGEPATGFEPALESLLSVHDTSVHQDGRIAVAGLGERGEAWLRVLEADGRMEVDLTEEGAREGWAHAIQWRGDELLAAGRMSVGGVDALLVRFLAGGGARAERLSGTDWDRGLDLAAIPDEPAVAMAGWVDGGWTRVDLREETLRTRSRATLMQVVALGGGRCELKVGTVAGRRYRVERTTDLKRWEQVEEWVASSANSQVIDREAGSRRGFYRVREVVR